MVDLKQIISKITGNEDEEEREEIPDDVTRDKHLRSLRRQRRVQNEETEKEQLIKQIADFNRERTSRHLFGIKSKTEKAKHLIEAIDKKKKVSVLQNGHRLLSNKVKKLKGNSLLGKSNMF